MPWNAGKMLLKTVISNHGRIIAFRKSPEGLFVQANVSDNNNLTNNRRKGTNCMNN